MSALFHNDFDKLLKERMQSHGGVDVKKFKESAEKFARVNFPIGTNTSASTARLTRKKLLEG